MSEARSFVCGLAQTLSERSSALKQKDTEASRLQALLDDEKTRLQTLLDHAATDLAQREERACRAEKEAKSLEGQLGEVTAQVNRLREEVQEKEGLEHALEGEVERLRVLLKGKGEKGDSQAEEDRRLLREKEEVITSLLERLEAFKDGLFAKERQLREQAARHALQLQQVVDGSGTQGPLAPVPDVEEFEGDEEGLPTHFQVRRHERQQS
jgi:chromosome segregation ATPase